MTDFTDPSLQLIEKRRSVDIFAATVVVSLVMHIFASLILVLPGRFQQSRSAAMFVDLQNFSPPMTAEERSAAEVENPEEKIAETVPVEPVQPSVPTPEADRIEKSVESTLQKAQAAPETVHESSIGLGMLSGHFASFAQGASLHDDIRVYYFALMRRINEVWWTNGASKGSFVHPSALNIVIARDGRLLGVELLESSGSREQDMMLMNAIKMAQPLPPLPVSYHYPTFSAPIRFAPPLRLMLQGKSGMQMPSLMNHGKNE